MPVAEPALVRWEPAHCSIGIQHLHPGDDVLHLAAVSSGIHIDCPAHCAGNAVGKFQPGIALLRGKIRRPCQGESRREPEASLAGAGDPAGLCPGTEHHAPQSLIRNQQVRARPMSSTGSSSSRQSFAAVRSWRSLSGQTSRSAGPPMRRVV